MKSIKKQLASPATLHWWNMGKKTKGFDGTLGELLKNHNIKHTVRKTDREGILKFYFKNIHGISYTATALEYQFSHYAKQAIQMELVRMGDKATLYVSSSFWRSTVTVNH